MRNRKLLIERLLTRDMLAGDFDPSFGVGGVLADPIVHESGSLDRVVETVLDPQGRVLVAANVETGRGIIASVSRFLPDGKLDRGFGVDGSALVPLDNGYDGLKDMALQADGRIVLLSQMRNPDGNTSLSVLLARLQPDGALDSSFGSHGAMNLFHDFPRHTMPAAIFVGAANELYIAAADNLGFMRLSKHLPSGEPDISFGDAGVALIRSTHPIAQDVVQLSDGSLMIASTRTTASGSYEAVVNRVLADGTVDPHFGNNGELAFATSNDGRYANYGAIRLAVDPSQNVFLAGMRRTDTAQDFFVAKFDSTGKLAEDFGTGGERFIPTHDGWGTLVNDLELLDDGSVVITGTLGYFERPIVVHLDSAGVIDTSRSPDGLNAAGPFQTVGSVWNRVAATVRLSDGTLVNAVSDYPSQDLRLIKTNSIGEIDPSFGAGGSTLLDVQPTWVDGSASGMTELADGKLLSIASDTYLTASTSRAVNIVLTRYLHDGSIDPTYGTDGRVVIPFDHSVRLRFPLISLGGDRFLAFQDGLTLRIAKLLSDGQIDASFGSDGWIAWELPNTPFPREVDSIVAIEDGFVLSASQYGTLDDHGYKLFKLDRQGQVDSTFGNQGEIYIPDRNASGNGSQLQLQSDGSLLVMLGNTTDTPLFQISVRRYSAHGQLDRSFGVSGVLTTGLSTGSGLDQERQMRVLADDRIAILGTKVQMDGTGKIELARFTADGQIDSSFGEPGSGPIVLPRMAYSLRPLDLQVDAQGRLIVAAEASDAFQTDTVIYRVNADGTLDRSFGSAGWVKVSLDNQFNDTLRHLYLTASGDILGAGERTTAVIQEPVYVRLVENLPPSPWLNPSRAEDVSADGYVTALDALTIINYLNTNHSARPTVDQPAQEAFEFWDVNGDWYVTALDALLVINAINAGAAGEVAAASGEAFAPSDQANVRASNQANIQPNIQATDFYWELETRRRSSNR